MYYALNEVDANTLDTVFSVAQGISNIGTGVKATKNKSNYSYSSIAKAASSLVAIFPVLTSRTVSAETAQTVSKFIEQKACNLLMLGLQQANIDSAKSGVAYLRKFHQNLDFSSGGIDTLSKTIEAWIDAYQAGNGVDGATNESSVSLREYNNRYDDRYFDNLLEADDIEISSTDIKNVMEAMAKLDAIEVYDTNLNPMSINDFVVKEFADGNYNVSIRNYEPLNEAKKRNNNSKKSNGNLTSYTYNTNLFPRTDTVANSNPNNNTTYTDRIINNASDSNSNISNKNNTNNESDDKNKINKFNVATILKDQDIKKMNDAIPSLLDVKFYHSDTATVATEFIIGVKSKLIPVTTTEVLRRIMNDNKDGKKFLNFMRTITGELSASEFLLGISRIKDDVNSCRVKGAYGDTWNLLKNRAAAAHDQVKRGEHNDYSAISTVLISREDAEELFRQENFDIADPKNALHFMESYNLMAFAIVDDATQVLKILFDDDSKIFEEYSYTMLERETKDGTYKKLINLMAASR